jgi:hypothetical protein
MIYQHATSECAREIAELAQPLETLPSNHDSGEDR